MRNYFDPADNSYGAVPDGDPIPDGCIEVEAQPSGDFEAHDERGNIIVDEPAKADFLAGADHIRLAHTVKAIEASLILAGIDVDGILKAEASATDIDLIELAQIVRSKQAEFVAVEVQRRTIKAKGVPNA